MFEMLEGGRGGSGRWGRGRGRMPGDIGRGQERLREVLAADRAEGGAPLRLGPLELDPGAYLARLEGQPLDLTRTEFGLLHLLMRNRGRAFSRAYLRDAVWGEPT